ncbi:MAG: hypothetical protein ACUVWJ_05425 [Spirochaetota bacterium]
MNNNVYKEDQALDPEIAALLGITEEKGETQQEEKIPIEETEVSKPIPKVEIRPLKIYDVLKDKKAYSKVISEGGEHGQKLHEVISKFLQAQEKDEKSMYREKIVPAYWNLLFSMVDSFFENLTYEKQALFRCGLLNSSFIDDNQKEILRKICISKTQSETIFFLDEWLLKVGNGEIRTSVVDETIKYKKKTPSALKSRLERKLGSREAEITNLRQKVEQQLLTEKSLQSMVSIITQHINVPDYGNLIAPYSNEQKKALTEIQDIVKSLQKSDRDIEAAYNTLGSLDQEVKNLTEKGGELEVEVDSKTVREEFSTLRQMIKLTVGRQGNHFPFLIRPYMPKTDRDVCTKEHLEETLKEIEALDPGIFIRTYKQEEHRIVPYFIIVPSYGDTGICWEPFDKMNKATGKGRLAIPMFPRDLKVAVLAALGDLRWQIAKEKSLHYWMEEGLTGYYYEYAQNNKLKGDLKDWFIQDYILWIKFESQGVQKLPRDVRAIFWRYIPFPQEIKDNLKNRGYYYADLYKKDQTRALSRGY